MQLSRRQLVKLGIAAGACGNLRAGASINGLHEEILGIANAYEKARRARFAAIKTKDELNFLQDDLRSKFLKLIGGLPAEKTPLNVRQTGQFEASDYLVRKIVFESMPGYFVPAVVYLPKNRNGRLPGVISPCGHSRNGKAHAEYQILHANLAKRGFVVVCFDPVGQGERSQFWLKDQQRSKFNLGCGEHAVLGSALELLGFSLARYRIWDGMRAIDFISSLPEVDPQRIGCVGNSGGGTLTSYITALDPRVKAAAIGCYITTLPRRMGNRIEMDPSSDPEQDIHGFVSEGIDHAGLLAMCAPRPTLICSATLDFFPIEGARESFNEARKLFELAGAGEKIAKAEAENRHSLSKPLREAVYGWFGHWLAGEPSVNPSTEIAITPRADIEMQSSPDGQVSVSFQSKNLLAIASEEFSSLTKPPEIGLRQVLQLDQEMQSADPLVAERGVGVEKSKTLILFVNGNEAADWREAGAMVKRIHEQGYGTVLIEPRGMGRRRQPGLNSKLNYTDPVSSIEANIAYNASLVGRSLLGMRVADLIKAIEMMIREYKPEKLLLCGSGDAALVALFAAGCEPRVAGVILENLLPSYEKALSLAGFALSEANLVPGIIRSYGDIPKVLSSLRPRPVLITSVASPDEFGRSEYIEIQSKSLATSPQMGGDWLRKHFGA